MKLLLLLFALVAVLSAQPLVPSKSELVEWEDFKIYYKREYKSTEEEEKRKSIFMDNLKHINEHNEKYQKNETKYYLAVNKFADLTKEEINSMMSGVKRPAAAQKSRKTFRKGVVKDMPYSFDWSTQGAVTAVKDQMACSSGGWAFSATGALEGQLFIKNNASLVSLSEQNLLDCTSSEGNSGCDGGTVDAAFTYVEKKKGLMAELDYTFEDGTGTSCLYKKSKRVKMDVTEYVDIESEDEDALQEAVYSIGPISAAINAQETDFLFYSGGVYDDDWCFSTAEYLNHYVLVVGWDYDYDDGDYWIIKNSWGEDWGISGYMYLSQFDFNMCGVSTAASYPVLS